MGRTVAAKVAARLIEAGLTRRRRSPSSRTPRAPTAAPMPAGSTNWRAIAARPELTGPVLIIVGDVVAAGAIAAEPAALAELAA